MRTNIDANGLELEDKVVTIKRVTKVVKGGRNMRFTALVVVGDKKGHVGCDLGKAAEVPEAIRKGKEDAMKHMIEIAMDENGSVPHDFTAVHALRILRYLSSHFLIRRKFKSVPVISFHKSYSYHRT